MMPMKEGLPHACHKFASCLLFFPTTIIIMATVWPPKRRRTGHKPPPMVEGDNSSLDTAMYMYSEGTRVLVPVRLDDPDPASIEIGADPDPGFLDDFVPQPADIEHHESRPRNRGFYMKEFVARVDVILAAMQAKEALPESANCDECADPLGYWRCEDCIGGRLLCRRCMRDSHFSNPFHRIEYWTGTHFCKAALWEVGMYLILPHQNDSHLCPNLLWQQQMLKTFQLKKDKMFEQNPGVPLNAPDYNAGAESVHGPDLENANDEAAMRMFDQLLAGRNADEVLEEDDEHEPDTEADLQDVDAGTAGFTEYIHQQPDPDSADQLHDHIPVAPNCDALANQYIRVVHTNGIHHIALVSCTCQGPEKIITDAIYAGWVPTSFI